MSKKAEGLSLNVIVVAALALLVLVILAIIFVGRIGNFNTESGKCEAYGGSCVRTSCNGDYQRQVGYDCNLDGDDTSNEGQAVDGICCVSI